MRFRFSQLFFRRCIRAILLTFVICLWVFSGINLFFDFKRNGLKSGNLKGQVLAQQSFASAVPTVFPSVSPKTSPKVEIPSKLSVSVNSSPEPDLKTDKINSSVSPESISDKGNQELFGEVNNFRKESGKGILNKTSNICNFASERFLELQSNYSHDGFSRMRSATGKNSGAENIAKTSSNRGNHYVVYEMWAKSEGHRQNMLGDYTEGCGYYDGRYAVLILAR